MEYSTYVRIYTYVHMHMCERECMCTDVSVYWVQLKLAQHQSEYSIYMSMCEFISVDVSAY